MQLFLRGQNTHAPEFTGEETEPDQASRCSYSCMPRTLTPLRLQEKGHWARSRPTSRLCTLENAGRLLGGVAEVRVQIADVKRQNG
ncbi:uncharacterized protein LOC144089706 isoform X2 [Stigmatopora argus]